MPAAVLEVIAMDAADAKAAQEGGADRLEVVADIAADGLSPALTTVEAIRAACELELRVMLRTTPDFAATNLAELVNIAGRFTQAGADGFVLGFLTPESTMDVDAMVRLAVAGGLPWTCHRAIDHAADYPSALAAVQGLPGLTQILTAGHPDGVAAGLPRLVECAAQLPVMAGGGLRPHHIGPLRRAGVRAFHIGSGARRDWRSPVRCDLVAHWRAVLNAPES
jgi:copper homeostasis protein